MFEKFSKFVGVQGVLAFALVGAVVTLALLGREIPSALLSLAAAAAGYYFGSKGETLTAQFTAWAWYAVPEWRRDRDRLKSAVSLIAEMHSAMSKDSGARFLEEVQRLESEVWG